MFPSSTMAELRLHPNGNEIMAVLDDDLRAEPALSLDDLSDIPTSGVQWPYSQRLEALTVREYLGQLAATNPAIAAIWESIEQHPDAAEASLRQNVMPRCVRLALAPFAPTIRARDHLWRSALAAIRSAGQTHHRSTPLLP